MLCIHYFQYFTNCRYFTVGRAKCNVQLMQVTCHPILHSYTTRFSWNQSLLIKHCYWIQIATITYIFLQVIFISFFVTLENKILHTAIKK